MEKPRYIDVCIPTATGVEIDPESVAVMTSFEVPLELEFFEDAEIALDGNVLGSEDELPLVIETSHIRLQFPDTPEAREYLLKMRAEIKAVMGTIEFGVEADSNADGQDDPEAEVIIEAPQQKKATPTKKPPDRTGALFETIDEELGFWDDVEAPDVDAWNSAAARSRLRDADTSKKASRISPKAF
ncbi:hypothetical protein KBD59_01785 [Candidatus Gracilibacteria bacterium]|nr:hypothetical protein [Candidatus Gracilibacteria bacterium]